MIDVMGGTASRDIFKDKIVLVGATSVGLNDVVATPFDRVLPGVELHANVIDNIIHSRFLSRRAALPFGKEGLIDLTIILIFGVVAALFLPKFNAAVSVFYTIVILAVFALFNYWTFVRLNLALGFIY